MSTRRAITFRCPETIMQAVENIMLDRDIDRTSVMKLALYLLTATLKRPDINEKDLWQLVRWLEAQAPEGMPTFAAFCEEE
ncbi:MAG: hypothetical protein ACI4O9_05940 [Akkermansia sp.]